MGSQKLEREKRKKEFANPPKSSVTVMDRKKEKIEMTDEEKKKFEEALKKPEFRELFIDYMKEMQDPANRAEYEREIAKYEAQVAAENAGKDPFAKPPPAKKEEKKIVEQPQAKSKSIVKGNRRNLQNPSASNSYSL